MCRVCMFCVSWVSVCVCVGAGVGEVDAGVSEVEGRLSACLFDVVEWMAACD